MDSSKTDHERITGQLTIWLTINDLRVNVPMVFQVFLANSITTWLTNQVNNQSLIPSTGVIQLTWLWRWQPQRLLKCQSLSITVLFRTTITWMIILNLLMEWLLGSKLSQFYHFIIYCIFTFIRQFNRGIKTIIIHSKYSPILIGYWWPNLEEFCV